MNESRSSDELDGPPVEANDVVRLLSAPSSYPESPARIELEETHISWVFLTENFAYKLKKPVRFDFLDFSTPQRRQAACAAEVQLNRRLAPHVYLGVLPVTRRRGGLELDGAGEPVDWLVKMHRLPSDASLLRRLASGAAERDDAARLAATLSQFYSRLRPLRIAPERYRSQTERHVRQNRRELLDERHGFDRILVERIHEAQLRLLRLASQLFDQRVLAGRIVEGHGDLRPEHIYLLSTPTVIDCVEFNAEYRQNDVADELSFLAMECGAEGACWFGEEVVRRCGDAIGDRPPEDLLHFYRSYRACVRAKVVALGTGRQRDEAIAKASLRLHLADEHAQALGPPLVVVTRGLSGTGKSTLAKQLAESLGISHLETDAIRRELFGASLTPAAVGDGNYRPERVARVYEELFRRCSQLLESGRSALLDGTFLSATQRRQVMALASSQNAAPLMVHCRCSEDVARRRIDARRASGEALSEARPDVYEAQKRREEPDETDLPVCLIDTEAPQASSIALVLEAIKASWANSR